MLRPLLTLVLLSSTAGLANAQKAPDCSNVATQMEITQCTYQEWQAADAELNTVYKSAMANMRTLDSDLSEHLKGAANALQEAQRAWLPYRDKACQSYGFLARGGTMEPMLVNICLTKLTQQRVKELKELAEGLGN
ncbi:lysozyme inhibitor LprI family protein [Roseibium sp. SCPC15]|uniref:lysozyme inhibitor LprI family protein n=1 Tax=Roseibium sp. SCP15 TaxID=3141376 RepID=UPI00333D7C46